ncbi:unnamed protein product [Aphanomyces euteiches]
MRLQDCKGIAGILSRLDASSISRSQKLLDKIKSSLVTQEQLYSNHQSMTAEKPAASSHDNVWVMSALFAILSSNELEKERDASSDVQISGVTLQELLEGCHVSLSGFLTSFTGLFDMLIFDLSPDLLHRANVLKERLTMAAILHSKYDQLWHQYADGPSNDARKQQLHEAGWLLFLIVRSRLQLSDNARLDELYYLLLSVLNMVLTKVNVQSVEAEAAAALSSLGSSHDQILEKLCAKPAVDQVEVERAIARLEREIQALEAEEVVQKEDEFSLFDPRVLADNVHNLASHYNETYVVHIYDLNEALFLVPSLKTALIGQPDETPPPPPVQSFYAPGSSIEQAWQWQGQYKQRPVTPSRASPLVAQTPVSAAVETNNWIRNVLTPLPVAPSEKLEAHFAACKAIQASVLIHQLTEELMSKLVMPPRPHLQGVVQTSVEGSLTKTKKMGLALFYKVLESLLDAESVRIQSDDFSSLLANPSFARALFACSMEVVLKTHSLVSLAFPHLLTTCEVSAFDFGKIIESFVKRAPMLPSELKRHMRDLEQTVLDSLVWASSSGLYTLLRGASKAAAVLQLFFRKVLALAANRIHALGQHLKLEAPYLNQVWTTVKECISAYHDLLRDRHLDHMILCSFYGVAKVNHVVPEVTFKRILDAYKRLYPTVSKSSIVREIPLDSTAKGDVIKFYNRCFIPTMKAFLLQFQLHDKQAAAAADAVTPFLAPESSNVIISDNEVIAQAATMAVERLKNTTSSKPEVSLADIQSLPRPSQRSSPKRVPGSNLYISPLRPNRHQRATLTPRTHALYAFGESPARDLALINRAVNPKRVNTLQFIPDDEEPPSPKRARIEKP